MQHGGVPELLLGLCYNATTGRLSIEVVKGSHFRNLALNRAPDTYVKLNLVSSTGQELAHSKTTVRRGQPNPLFKETFVFQVRIDGADGACELLILGLCCRWRYFSWLT